MPSSALELHGSNRLVGQGTGGESGGEGAESQRRILAQLCRVGAEVGTEILTSLGVEKAHKLARLRDRIERNAQMFEKTFHAKKAGNG